MLLSYGRRAVAGDPGKQCGGAVLFGRGLPELAAAKPFRRLRSVQFADDALRGPEQGTGSGQLNGRLDLGCEVTVGTRAWDLGADAVADGRGGRGSFATADSLGVRYLTDDRCGVLDRPVVDGFLDDFLDNCDLVHLTIDLDVLPASVAPGVSAPAGFGVPVETIEHACTRVAASGKLALCDVAELNPALDVDARTARTASRLVHRVLTEHVPPQDQPAAPADAACERWMPDRESRHEAITAGGSHDDRVGVDDRQGARRKTFTRNSLTCSLLPDDGETIQRGLD